MSQRITIEIKDKIATCLTEAPVVCGNADYVVDFAFDEEWEKYEIKTAIFVVNGKATPQVFAGNVCPIPVIQNTLIAWVGVFAGTVDDGTLSTSTPALVKCVPCITDGDNIPMSPPDDVYNQIIGLIESGMLRGEQGEKGEKGDKGDAGSIKFTPVTELPTANIEEATIYLLPMDGTGEENRFAEYVYIDGKWEVLGAVTVNVDHSEYVKFTDYATASNTGVVKVTGYGIKINNKTGEITPVWADEQSTTNRHAHHAINAKMIDYAVMSALADCKDTTLWTDEGKAKACETIGAVAQSQPASGVRLYGSNNVKQTYYDLTKSGVLSLEANNIVTTEIATNEAKPYSMVKRSALGVIYAGTPTENGHATTKKYVDDLIAELRAEIDALKGV